MRQILIVLTAIMALIAGACAGSEEADGDTVTTTEGMSTSELTEFAGQALRAAFNDKVTINMTVEVDMLELLNAYDYDEIDIEAELEAEGKTVADAVMRTQIVTHIDGSSFLMTTTITDGGLFDESGEASPPARIIGIDGVIYQELPRFDDDAVTGDGLESTEPQWLVTDDETAAQQAIDVIALQYYAFDDLHDVVDHGFVERNGQELQRITASLRGNDLLSQQVDQQQQVTADLGGLGGEMQEQMLAIQAYIAEHSVTSFDFLLDADGQVVVVELDVHIDAEEQYLNCAVFRPAQSATVIIEFEDFPDDLVITAPPGDSVTSTSDMFKELGLSDTFEEDGMLNPEWSPTPEMQQELLDTAEAMIAPMMANCPTA